jgi:hypothetical protein
MPQESQTGAAYVPPPSSPSPVPTGGSGTKVTPAPAASGRPPVGSEAYLQLLYQTMQAKGIQPGSPQWNILEQQAKQGVDVIPYIPASAGAANSFIQNGDARLMYQGKTITMEDLFRIFHSMSQTEMNLTGMRLYLSGQLSSPNADQMQIWDAFARVGTMAAYQYAATGDKAADFEDIMKSLAKGWGMGAGDATKNGAGSDLPPTKTDVRRDPNISNPTEASRILTDALKQKLGRAPTKAEKAAFLGALNAEQGENPLTTTTTYSGLDTATGTYEDVTAKHTGGVDAAQFADEYAATHNDKEYKAYQAATTYWSAMMSALQAPVDTG